MPGGSFKLGRSRALGAVGLSSLIFSLACTSSPPPSGERSRQPGSSTPQVASPADDGAAGAPSSAGSFGNSNVGMAPPPPPMRDPVDVGECSAVTAEADPIPAPVDIIWVVDASLSMIDEQDRINQNIQSFAADISSAGIDHHVIILTDRDLALGTTLGGDPEHYLFLPSLVDSHNAWAVVLQQYPQYQHFLRPDASTHIIAVSDDESSMLAPDFQSQMEANLGKGFIHHAIASEQVAGLAGIPAACPGAFAPGFQYYMLSDSTGGQAISICTQDWSMVFGPLKQAVIESAPLPCNYPIPAPPAGEVLDPALVNVEYAADGVTGSLLPKAEGLDGCGDQVAWYYDSADAPSEVLLCPAACDTAERGGALSIAFGCATVPLE